MYTGSIRIREAKNSQVTEVYMPPRDREKMVEIWDFKREEGNSHGHGKTNVRYTNVCRAMQRQWDTEDFE